MSCDCDPDGYYTCNGQGSCGEPSQEPIDKIIANLENRIAGIFVDSDYDGGYKEAFEEALTLAMYYKNEKHEEG